MAMEQGRVTEFEGKSLDQIQIEPEGRAVEILSQTDGLKETSSGEPSTIHPDAPHGSGSAPSERCGAYCSAVQLRMAGSLFRRLSLEEGDSVNSLDGLEIKQGDQAMHQALDTLSDSTSSTTANDLDLIFLKGIMESPVAHDRLEEPKLEAVRENNMELVLDILKELSPLTHRSQAADELVRILKEPHFQRATHLVLAGDLVPAGTALVTPDPE
uniref:L27 domain-containing protein n=1 Tax=Knipowitschia caucasica TaxID=637954 RepID=A0AAV2LDB4_KNICA